MDWDVFFSVFLKNKDVFYKFLDLIPQSAYGNIFHDAIKNNLFIQIKEFVEKYKRIPTFDELLIVLDNLPETEKENKKAYVEFINKIRKLEVNIEADVFSDQITKEILSYEMEHFIKRSAPKVVSHSITPEDMVGDLRNIMVKFEPKSRGVDVTDVGKSIILMRQDHSERSSTGVNELDRVLHGGYGLEEIAIMMAPPGTGKSFFLINAMYYAMQSNKSVLYVTLELSERAVLRRLYSRVAYANRKEMLEEKMIASRAGLFFRLAKAEGRIINFPGRSLSVSGLEAVLEQQMMYYGMKPNILIVDYLDEMSPRATDNRLDPRFQLRNITSDLRSIASRYNIPVLSATQANRESLSQEKITKANVSESFGKVEVADVVLALCQNEDEKMAKKARLVVVKNRDGVSDDCFEFYTDFDTMFLSGMEEASRLGLAARVNLERDIK
jgi:KaiC/GvpD/RAD55 family RecA-like ATPase